MKFTSPVYSAASGSVAGVTYSRNKGGMYTRSRAIPSNPNSASQLTVRDNLTVSSQAWSGLTQAQRDEWNALAPTVAWTNTLGQSIQLSGINLFNQVNSLRLLAGMAVLEAAPADVVRVDVPLVEAVETSAGSLDVTTTNSFAATDKLLVFVSRPTNPGRSTAAQPKRFVGIGETVAPGPLTLSATDPFGSAAVAQIRTFRFVVVSATILPSPNSQLTIALTAGS